MKLIYFQVLAAALLLCGLSLHATNITFQVDMSAETVSPDGVSVAYAPNTVGGLGEVVILSLEDGDGDGVYVGTSDVTADTIGYFFVNGMAGNPANFEMVPDECALTVTFMGLSFNVRPYEVGEVATLDVVCFAGCGSCAVTDCGDPNVIFSDDASTYDLGTLPPTGPWQAWPGGADGIEIDTLDGDNVFALIGDPMGQDAYFDTGDLTEGHYLFYWNQYIPAGNTAYFNVQHQDPITTAGYWAFDVFFGDETDGEGRLELNDNGGTDDTEYTFEYPEDEFFFVGVIVDLDNDQARLLIDDYTVAAWTFSDGVTNGNVEFDLNQFSGINFYPIDATHVWFLDDVNYVEIPAATTGGYCYTATTITPGTHTVDDLACFGGGLDFDDLSEVSAQWFEYTPAEDGWISLSSCSAGSDSRGWILTGDCNDPVIVGLNDDQCELAPGSEDLWASYKEATVNAGQTYYIMWDNPWDDTGFEFELTFNDTELEPGDFCESALDVTPGEFIEIAEFTGDAAVAGFTVGNTNQGTNPAAYARSEWFQYTPTEDGTITITSCELSATDNRVWVYTGECGTFESLALVATDDDGCGVGGGPSLIEDFPVVAGTTYYIEWDNGWSDELFAWQLDFSPPIATSEVTFQVDMNLVGPDPEGVFIAGSFSDFNNVEMDDSDADGVYTVTLDLENNTMYTYKFKNGPDGWETIDTSLGDDCTTGEFGDRFVMTGEMEMTEDLVCFSYCVTCDLVDVDEVAFEQGIELFPNPTDGDLMVRIRLPETVDGLRVRVSSLLGTTLLERRLGNLQRHDERIDLNHLPVGTYVVTLTNGTLQTNRKVVIR